MRKTFGVWKTTILGGVIFLLPFAVVVFLLGQLAALIVSIAGKLDEYVPDATIGIVSSATIAATLLLVAICFLAGLAARRSFATRFSDKVEKTLLLLFPRYAILKNQMASNLASHAGQASMQPVLVRFDDAARIGFETDRAEGGLVTIYLPGAPDPWSGHLVHVAAERVTKLAAPFGDATAVCETLGRMASTVITKV
jgi:uncharacterized membrane protein